MDKEGRGGVVDKSLKASKRQLDDTLPWQNHHYPRCWYPQVPQAQPSRRSHHPLSHPETLKLESNSQ